MSERAAYLWGKKDFLLGIPVGSSDAVPYLTDKDYNSWRTIGSKLYSEVGASFKFSRIYNIIKITRIV